MVPICRAVDELHVSQLFNKQILPVADVVVVVAPKVGLNENAILYDYHKYAIKRI